MQDERDFLHELATPLTVALMRLSAAQESLQGTGADLADLRLCVDEGADALLRACAMIDKRRSARKQEAQRPSRKILVVDDDADLRDAIAFDLQRKGYQVLQAGSGNEAFKVVLADAPDLVISDIRMPDGDGVELLKRVKERDHEMPVLIFVTGFADLGLPEAYQLGADAVLSKPFQRATLLQTVERALLSREARWRERPERVNADASILLRLPAFEQALRGHLINIGRGGFFVALEGSLPPAGSRVDFAFHFVGESEALRGQGLVRWCRSQPGGVDQPVGCGIEFSCLDAKSLDRIQAYIDEVKAKAFIPAA